MNFVNFKNAVAEQFAKMSKHPLLVVKTEHKHELFENYLAAFPAGSDPIYKTRTEHDCNCCKQFIRMIGDVIAIIDGKVHSIWDVTIEGEPEYQVVADALSKVVHSRPVVDFFMHYEPTVGVSQNFEQVAGGSPIKHNHFSVTLPSKNVVPYLEVGKVRDQLATDAKVLQRALNDFTIEGVDTILELINGDNLYRGTEDKHTVEQLRKILVEYSKLKTDFDRAAFPFVTSSSGKFNAPTMRVYNTLIGDMILVASIDGDLEAAVKAYETAKAGPNYKRPKSLVTPQQVERAKKKIIELGLDSALDRRYANVRDISVENLLFVDRSIAKSVGASDDFFEGIATKVASNPKKFDAVERISLQKFIDGILPNVSGVEVFVKNQNVGNLVSLITATDPTSRNMFLWDNKFSWSYNGDFADSVLKNRVKSAGGSVTGELLCRLGWDNKTDLDFHMHEADGSHIYFGTRGSKSRNGGKLDVDANGGSGMMDNPVENIFYEKISDMKDGQYRLVVNNYSDRTRAGDSRAYMVEIEMNGQTYRFEDEFTPGMNKVVALINKKGDTITIDDKSLIKSSNQGSEVWGIETEDFVKCNAIMHSPNFWGENGIGNKHIFFMLDKCVNEGSARGFYNEYLTGELNEHRKVLEIVAAKKRTQETENQLSGLGFSFTGKQEVLVRVTGKTQRMYKVFF